MDFIIITTQEGYEMTVKTSNIVSFYDSGDSTHISFVNQEYVWTQEPIATELRKLLRMMNFGIAKVGIKK